VGADLGPEFRSLLGDWSGDGAALGLALVVDDDAGVVLAVEEGAVGSSPGPALADDDSGVHFLSQLLHSLLHRTEHHVADGSGGQPVETAAHTLDCDDEEVLGAGVVGAVESGGDGQAAGDSELDTDCSCLGLFSHMNNKLIFNN
jgi:hypothetical protein